MIPVGRAGIFLHHITVLMVKNERSEDSVFTPALCLQLRQSNLFTNGKQINERLLEMKTIWDLGYCSTRVFLSIHPLVNSISSSAVEENCST